MKIDAQILKCGQWNWLKNSIKLQSDTDDHSSSEWICAVSVDALVSMIKSIYVFFLYNIFLLTSS